MNELSLFTGAGGGLLGSLLLGWRTIGAVEIDPYCCEVLNARQRDGMLDRFPIWNLDIREFNERIAEQYEGMVDVLSGGFPCQPFSTAGKRLGADDERNMWPATIDAVRRIRPRYVFLENVPALLANVKERYYTLEHNGRIWIVESCQIERTSYTGRILGDLAESGYECRWRILSAAEVGAPHLRKRLWIVAYAKGGGCSNVADSRGLEQARADGSRHSGEGDVSGQSAVLANANSEGLENGAQGDGQREQDDPERSRVPAKRHGGWWEVEPDVGRVAHGVASRVDRLRALGNGQVPHCMAAAWSLLIEEP